jgi:putative ABC transport system permease protein
VNEALVNEYFAGVAPIGRVMAQGLKGTPDMEIIGVFGNARYDGVRGVIPRQLFMGMDSRSWTSITVLARIQGDPRRVMPALREQTRRVDPNLVVFDMRALSDHVNMRLSNERLLSLLSVGFALLASVLTVVGLHGVLTFVVARRTREIVIRIALGADRNNVVRLVMREILPLILFGIAGGVVAALLCGRFVESQLFGRPSGVCDQCRDFPVGIGRGGIYSGVARIAH